MNKEQIQRLHYLCDKLGPTANALVAITDFSDNFDSEALKRVGTEALEAMEAGLYYCVPNTSDFNIPMSQEEKLTKIIEVLEEAYKTIIEE